MGELIAACIDILAKPFDLFGFTVSLWDVFLFSILASICGWGIGRLLK